MVSTGMKKPAAAAQTEAMGCKTMDNDETMNAVVFNNCQFYYSFTLEYADWQAVISVLQANGRADLVDKMQPLLGFRQGSFQPPASD